jgi:putative FmdB family regulatory protein
MPIYTYLCEKGHETEMTQRITDEPSTMCWCGEPCRRLIPIGTTFVLRGEGWTR